MRDYKDEAKEKKVLQAVEQGKITSREISDFANVNKIEFHKYIRRLITQGMVKTQRGNGWTKYIYVGNESKVLLDKHWKPLIFNER